MTTVLLPDAEKLVVDYLLAAADLDSYLSDRIYTAIPNDPTWPLARVTLLDTQVSYPRHIADTLLQVDVYGGSKKTARDAADTIAGLLAEPVVGTHTLGTVSWASTTGPRWLPDAGYTPARARYVVEATLTIHP